MYATAKVQQGMMIVTVTTSVAMMMDHVNVELDTQESTVTHVIPDITYQVLTMEMLHVQVRNIPNYQLLNGYS